jgi:hypothetical protein
MKPAKIFVSCTPEQKEKIRTMAKKEACTMSDLLLSKTLDIELKDIPDKREYLNRIYIAKIKKGIH